MRIRRVSIENVRSFLDRAELILDGQICIVIGPNGGGKTNLLDIMITIIRRYLFASMYAIHAPTAEIQNRYELRENDILSNMVLDRHSAGANRPQFVEVEIEVTASDIENMLAMQMDAERLTQIAGQKYTNFSLNEAAHWKIEEIRAKSRFTYQITNGQLQQPDKEAERSFLRYLKLFEIVGRLREEFEFSALSTPVVYLPINRAANGFQSSVELAGYNDHEVKRNSDTASSRSPASIVSLAVGRLAQKYRLLLEKNNINAMEEFRSDPNLQDLTQLLGDLGYEWSLETINPLKNQYDIRLLKQGSSFLVGSASSGERELLTYLFAIYALNVRDALIIVDEPELHLHPKWQKTLLQMFIHLSKATANQFLLATHSPTFVSPKSVQYISRVFSRTQQSRIIRIDIDSLPESKHLFNIINTQNNERLFFADRVILVEGLSDRIFFEAVLDKHAQLNPTKSVVEVISVGGKYFFETYTRILRACSIEHAIIADLDYAEQIAPSEIKDLFRVDTAEIKKDVLENSKSLDGDALVQAIDQALASGNWDHAKRIWDYIKSRRRKLQQDITSDRSELMRKFLAEARSSNIYILQRGALEAYLPSGHASKDLDKLIRLVADTNFLERLPIEGRDEISEITEKIIQKPV